MIESKFWEVPSETKSQDNCINIIESPPLFHSRALTYADPTILTFHSLMDFPTYIDKTKVRNLKKPGSTINQCLIIKGMLDNI